VYNNVPHRLSQDNEEFCKLRGFMSRKKDFKIIRELAKQVAKISSLPEQEKTRSLWRKLNGKYPTNPNVYGNG